MGLFNYFIQPIVDQQVRRAVDNAYYKGLFQWLNDGQSILDPDSYEYLDAYKTTGAVYECVDLITKKILACPIVVYRIKDSEGYKTYKNLLAAGDFVSRAKALKLRPTVLEEVSLPRINKLLNRPNEAQDMKEFLRILSGFYLLRGNAFMYGNAGDLRSKKWTELFAIPTTLQIISGGMFEPIKNYYLGYGTLDQATFPADQIKHIKTFNPFYSPTGTHLYGMSPLSAYLHSIDNIDQANKQSGKQLKNGGKMGFISPKNKEDQLTPDQRKALKEGLGVAHSSKERVARIIPASVPMEWTEIGLSSADMELLETKSVSADDIYLAYHVPLQMRRTDASSYNNLTTQKKAFIYDAVAPVADEIASALTEFICTPYMTQDNKNNYVIRLDYQSLPELAADMVEMSNWVLKSYELTWNEKRELKGFGRLEAPGMDDIFIPKNYVRLQDVMDGKVNNSESSGPGSTPDDIIE